MLPPSACFYPVTIISLWQVELSAASALPCIVSFAAGQERRVYFAVVGAALPWAQHAADARARGGGASWAQHADGLAAVLHSSPAVVLADPAPAQLNAGVVASMSPLMVRLSVAEGCNLIYREKSA